jgi:hypothetical protein
MGEIYSKTDKKQMGAGVCHLCGDLVFSSVRAHTIRSKEHKRRLKIYFEAKAKGEKANFFNPKSIVTLDEFFRINHAQN